MTEIAVDGAPTTGKSSLIEAVSAEYEVVPELATFLPERVRPYPETAAAHERRVLAEFENLTYRAERYGGDGDTICEMSVVTTVALGSLLGELVGVDDLGDPIAVALDGFGDAVRHPDVFVFLTAPPAVVRARWEDRPISSTFWSDPAIVAYLNEFYRRVADRVPSVVIDTDTLSRTAAVARLLADTTNSGVHTQSTGPSTTPPTGSTVSTPCRPGILTHERGGRRRVRANRRESTASAVEDHHHTRHRSRGRASEVPHGNASHCRLRNTSP